MRTARHFRRLLTLMVGFTIAGSSTAAAIDPCPGDRYLPYSTIFYGAHIPRAVAGRFPDGSFAWVACSNNPFHANYAGLAVGQTQVFGKPVSYYAPCVTLSVQVMNGSFAWGPSGFANGGSGAVAQSTIAGSVLSMRLTMFSEYGASSYIASWTANQSCPVW